MLMKIKIKFFDPKRESDKNLFLQKAQIMKINSLFALLILSILQLACSRVTDNESVAIIKGAYHQSNSSLYLDEVHASFVKRLDSVELSSGEAFEFKVNSPDYALFKIVHDNLYPLIVVAKNGDTIMIKETDDPAWPFRVNGNKESMLLAEYFEKLNRDEHKVDSLSLIFHNSQSHPDFLAIREELNRAFIDIHQAHRQWARDFVARNPGSFAALVMINSFFKEFLLFDQKDDFEYYEMVADAVMKTMPANQYAIDLNTHVEKIRKQNKLDSAAMVRLAPGKKAPGFNVFTEDNRRINPEDLKGKNVLLYFWASHSAPSRQANPFINEIYKQYHAHGLELITISFDRSKEMWTSAISLDELPGIHCIDTRGPGSPIQTLFNIKMHLPLYFLIDKAGVIYSSGRDFRKLSEELGEMTSTTQ